MRKFYEDTMKRYMDELQGCPPVSGHIPHHNTQPADGQALDLRSSSADLDHESHRSENDNDSDSWDKNLSGGEDSSSEHNRGLGSDFDVASPLTLTLLFSYFDKESREIWRVGDSVR